MKELFQQDLENKDLYRVSEKKLSELSELQEHVEHQFRDIEQITISQKNFFHKKVRGPSELLEIEAFCGEIYALLLGREQAPLSYVVINDLHEITGLLVEAIDNFQSGDQLHQLGINELIQKNLICILVAAYIMKEDDLHKNNIGKNKDGLFSKIDHDMSLWDFGVQYKGDRIQQVINYKAMLRKIASIFPDFITQPLKTGKAYLQSCILTKEEQKILEKYLLDLSPERKERLKFPFTEKDIRLFPFIRDATPYYWPVYWLNQFTDKGKGEQNAQNFHEAPLVNEQKWLTFSIFLLIPPQFIIAAAYKHVQDKEFAHILIEEVEQNRNELKQVLFKNKDFGRFISLTFICETMKDATKEKSQYDLWGVEKIKKIWKYFSAFQKENEDLIDKVMPEVKLSEGQRKVHCIFNEQNFRQRAYKLKEEYRQSLAQEKGMSIGVSC